MISNVKFRSNIVFISTHDIGGISTFLNNTLEYLLSKKKFNIFFYDQNPYKFLNKNIKKKINIFKTSVINNTKSTQKIFYSTIKDKEFKKTIIFITNYIILLKYFFFLVKFKINGGKIFLSLHSGLLTYTLKRYIGCLFSSFTFFLVDKLYYNSKYTKLWWHFKFPWLLFKKSKIIKLGIKIKKVNLIKKSGFLKVSFVGRLENEKNPQLFLELAKYCHLLGLNYKFQLYGHGSLFKFLKKKYSRFAEFRGWNAIKNIYNNTDVVIITSKIETFSYVAIEAKNYGIPIITCSYGGIIELVKNDGIICKSNKYDLLESLKMVNKNYIYYSKNSLKNKKKYNIINTMRSYALA